jgi:hypothetical protein
MFLILTENAENKLSTVQLPARAHVSHLGQEISLNLRRDADPLL